jgi:predicted metalloenzyme YecM
MINQAYLFLDKIFSILNEKKINIEKWEIDHLCYRTTDLENYEKIKNDFSKLGDFLIESEVNGRNIATYRLNSPVVYKGYTIPLVEVPAPKNGKPPVEGWEHIEVVIDIGFDELMKKYPEIDFDTKALSKELNPELVIKFGDCAIKFHHQSLDDVIKIEKKSL